VREHRSIPQPLQDKLIAALGIKGVLELVVLLGFYEMIAGVIFAFEVPLPEGAADPFS
jgi:4-carboxymuconolactone decarboxylase